MKWNKLTLALAAAGAISGVQADESHPVNTLVSNTVLSGFVDTSAIWNFGTGKTVASRFANTAYDRQDGFNLNVVKLNLEKPLDEGTWSAGYRVDMMFGPDSNVMPGRLGSSDIAIQQAYVALRVPVGNGLDLKVGQFNPTIGYEVTDSYANPNFSRSMAFNTLEPFGHQGVLGTYQVNEILGFNAGISNTQFGDFSGAAGGINTKYAWGGGGESWKSYMAGLVIKAPESTGWLAGSSLYGGVVKGFAGGEDNDPVNFYVGGTMSTPWKALSLGVAYDYLANGSFEGSYGNSIAGYASLQVTEQFKINGRAEYVTSSGGVFSGYTNGPGTKSQSINDESFMGY
ncbi:MAG: outer membrane beta-barrel protein, partial [Verrucomicrobiota bacterium]